MPRQIANRTIFAGDNRVAAEKHKRQRIGMDISRKAADPVKRRLRHDLDYPLLFAKKVTARGDIPRRSDAGPVKPAKNSRRILFGRQQGRCTGCKHDFPFRNFTIDHRIPLSGAGTMEELPAKLEKEPPPS